MVNSNFEGTLIGLEAHRAEGIEPSVAVCLPHCSNHPTWCCVEEQLPVFLYTVAQ